MAFYVVFYLLGIIKKVSEYESKIIKKDFKKLLQSKKYESHESFNEQVNSEEIAEENSNLTEHLVKMKNAEETWKTTPNEQKDDFQKLFYYGHKINRNQYFILVFSFVFNVLVGTHALNINKISLLITVIGFLVLSTSFLVLLRIRIHLEEKFAKYEEKTRPAIVDKLFKILK